MSEVEVSSVFVFGFVLLLFLRGGGGGQNSYEI